SQRVGFQKCCLWGPSTRRTGAHHIASRRHSPAARDRRRRCPDLLRYWLRASEEGPPADRAFAKLEAARHERAATLVRMAVRDCTLGGPALLRRPAVPVDVAGRARGVGAGRPGAGRFTRDRGLRLHALVLRRHGEYVAD